MKELYSFDVKRQIVKEVPCIKKDKDGKEVESVKKSQKTIEKEIRKDIVKEAKKAKKFFEESGFRDPNKLRSDLFDRTASDLIDLQILLKKGKMSKATFDLAKNAIEKANGE